MNKLRLSIATTDYDHFRDFRTGAVQAEGIDTTWSLLGYHKVFARFTAKGEWAHSAAVYMRGWMHNECSVELTDVRWYQARTGVWPITHIIAIQRHILDENPWVARNLLNAFNALKRRSVEQILDPAISRDPLPFVPAYARRMQAMFGKDPFPFGIEENHPTWEQMLLYRYQQGIARAPVTPGDIFPNDIMTSVAV